MRNGCGKRASAWWSLLPPRAAFELLYSPVTIPFALVDKKLLRAEFNYKRERHALQPRPETGPHDDVVALAAAQRLHVVAHGAASFAVGVPVNCYNFSLREVFF